MQFNHSALKLKKEKDFVFTALSKQLFYFRMYISKYVLEQNKIPLNPFMTFDYFMLDTVDRDIIREGNNNLLRRSDELWVFGDISDGVLAEIKMAKGLGKPIKYFIVEGSKNIVPVSFEQVQLEEEVGNFRKEFILLNQ